MIPDVIIYTIVSVIADPPPFTPPSIWDVLYWVTAVWILARILATDYPVRK